MHDRCAPPSTTAFLVLAQISAWQVHCVPLAASFLIPRVNPKCPLTHITGQTTSCIYNYTLIYIVRLLLRLNLVLMHVQLVVCAWINYSQYNYDSVVYNVSSLFQVWFIHLIWQDIDWVIHSTFDEFCFPLNHSFPDFRWQVQWRSCKCTVYTCSFFPHSKGQPKCPLPTTDGCGQMENT